MIILDHDKEDEYAKTLQDIKAPISDRVNSLFCLRNIATLTAIDSLIKAFKEEPRSELLRHEICYCLGQMDKTSEHVTKIQKFLEEVVDSDHEMIVIHEAVEALGNMNSENTLRLLKKFENEQSEILYQTCDLTIKLIEWNQATDNGKSEGLDKLKYKYTTNDPAPPFNYIKEPKYNDISYLTQILLDNENYDLFKRYRALFTLREINTEESVVAISQTLRVSNFEKCSALLKHEVAFVLAQMEFVFKPSVPYLLEAINYEKEDPIVRHEALVALGEMVDDKSVIDHFLQHPDQIVNESCQVALSSIEYRKQFPDK